MAAETVLVALDDTAYTALSSGQPDVTVQVRPGSHVRVIMAEALPAVGATAYAVGQGNDSLPFSGLAATTIVYARAENGSADVVVLRQ